MKRLFAGITAVAMVLALSGAFTGSASAQTMTVDQIMAMIAQLQAQLAALGGSSSSGHVYNVDLTVGSTGADVVALQQMLVAKGFLTMPAGVAMGYFGNLTKNAVAAWQASAGITPSAGFFGPKSRAYVNAMVSTPTTPSTPGSTTGISTPGVEGTLTATLNPTPGAGTKVYEGDTKAAALGVKLEAKLSDIKVERVKVQLPSTTFYNKIASRIYVMDGSTVLAESALNSSTVVKESSNYFITLSGINYIVPVNSTRVLTIALDIYGSIDSTLTDGDTFTLTIPADGVRGIDGAGVSQYSPSSPFSRTITPQGDLTEDATLKLSTNSNTPKTTEVVAASGSNEDELDGLTLLTFDLKAEKDDVLVTDLVATVTAAGTANASTTYLYDGSTLVGSASVSGSTATFSDIDYTVPKDTTKTLTLKVDVRDAASAATTFAATIASNGPTAENSQGDVVNPTGSATSNNAVVRNVGPQFTLLSKPIEKSATASQNNTSTSTAKATYSLKIKAVGGDIYFGPQSSSSTFNFVTYKGSTATTLLVSSTTSFTVPSSGVVTSGIASGGFILQENNEVTLPVEFLFEGRTTAGALVSTDTYAIALDSVKWNTGGATQQTSSFMSGQVDWRTSGVSLP